MTGTIDGGYCDGLWCWLSWFSADIGDGYGYGYIGGYGDVDVDGEDDNGGGDGGDGDSHLAIRREALVAVDGLGVAELDILVFVPICKSC